jgi:hypothetical protein
LAKIRDTVVIDDIALLSGEIIDKHTLIALNSSGATVFVECIVSCMLV